MEQSVNKNAFKNKVFKSLRPAKISIFDWHNPKGINFLTRLRLVFSQLSDQKFKHGFQDTFHPLSNCEDYTESNNYILHFPSVLMKRQLSWSKPEISITTSWRKMTNYLFERLYLVTANFLILTIRQY